MTPKEIGMMIKALRDGKEVICPECKTGKIITPYNPKQVHISIVQPVILRFIWNRRKRDDTIHS